MAIQAKSHTQMLGVMNLFHLVNTTMAFDATDTAVDMDSMVEINIVWSFMNAFPGNGWPCVKNTILVQVLVFG